jgi:outer membrane cobalamin receptor
MKKMCIIVFFLATIAYGAKAQYSLSGKVLDNKTELPVEYAVVSIDEKEIHAVTDEKGGFLLKNMPKGETKIVIVCLGYVGISLTLNVAGDVADTVFRLHENNLALDEVVISAKSKAGEGVASYVVDQKALEHLQALDVADVMSLLPGGRTNLALHQASDSRQRIAVRSAATGEGGNPTFGTAIEVDGVRLSGNSLFGDNTSNDVKGVDTRNIASSNIESVEVVTGVPSAEYGDLTGGMVKINTRKGISPLRLDLTSKPNVKQIALSKGFSPGRRLGVLNVALERTRSIAALESPHTSYERNSLSLTYENSNLKGRHPVRITIGCTGNLGGYDSKADPDAFRNTYTRESDNTLRAHARVFWTPDLPWLTSVEATTDISRSSNLREEKTDKMSTSSVPAIHGREEGYFVAANYDENPDAAIVLIPPGYRYQTRIIDSRPTRMSLRFKVRNVRRFGPISSTLAAGAEFSKSFNGGRGEYYDDPRNTPTWHEYRFDSVPALLNSALWIEEKVGGNFGLSALQLTAGLRADLGRAAGSDYGRVSGLSPRFNARYHLRRRNSETWLESLVLKAGWGKSVKLPSLDVLAPRPAYTEKQVFAPGAMSDGTVFYAFYLMPFTMEYNAALRWQHARQFDLGVEARIRGVFMSLSFFASTTRDSYTTATDYRPFSYRFTEQTPLETFPIPSANRRYSIDRTTGTVTVHDRTGAVPDTELPSRERRTFKPVSSWTNSTPVARQGVEWIVDFGKIRAIATSVRIDGSFYRSRGTNETMDRYSPVSQNMANGEPYKYVGIYAGGNGSSNGTETRHLNANLTLTTHIPAVRLIISMRLEASLIDRTQRLSEYGGAPRGFAIDSRGSLFPAAEGASEIYGSNRYTALYPVAYLSLDDMNTPVPFAESFARARENDPTLFNELAKLVTVSNTDYYFNEARISGYYSANLSVTKEIGDYASVSFNATNFTNNMQLIRSSDTGIKSTIYDSSRIPRFYYGLSLKLKLNKR